jgi:uncharacterized protein (TIGR03792 family)
MLRAQSGNIVGSNRNASLTSMTVENTLQLRGKVGAAVTSSPPASSIASKFLNIQVGDKAYRAPMMRSLPVDYPVVEQLRLSVPAAQRSAWLYAERNSWQPWLEQQTGYLGRQLLWEPSTELGMILIQWASRDAWKAIPSSAVETVQLQFEAYAREATGQPTGNPFPLVAVSELVVPWQQL